MDLSQRMEFRQELLYFFENFVSVKEPLTKSRFDVPIAQISLFILFVSAEVSFEGLFFL